MCNHYLVGDYLVKLVYVDTNKYIYIYIYLFSQSGDFV